MDIVPHTPQPESDWEVESLLAGLRDARSVWRSRYTRTGRALRRFPSPHVLLEVLKNLKGALFPMRLASAYISEEGEEFQVAQLLRRAFDDLFEQVRIELGYESWDAGGDDPEQKARAIVSTFASSLPALRRALDSDVEAAFLGDPAARSVDEVLICYPGVAAIINYRIAHALHILGATLVARILSEISHSETGIDIHPGATIGGSFFIDHGTGVVIGETARIGDNVRLYHGVTLGSKSFRKSSDDSLRVSTPRHPIIEDDVVIYAGATILGRITIGRGAVIGGNVWVTENVAPGSQISQASIQMGFAKLSESRR